MALELSLIGGFAARIGRSDLRIASRRGRALLALLALEPGRRMTRDRVAVMLWPDRGEAQARASLRQEVSSLRRCLGDAADALIADADSVQLDPAVSVDALELVGPSADPDRVLSVAPGRMLADVDLRSEPFQEWRDQQVRAFEAHVVAVAEGALAAAENNRDWNRLAEIASRLLAFDPLSEAAVAGTMRAACARGRAPEALAAFADHARRLKAELDAEPGAALAALRDRIASDSRPAAAESAQSTASIFERPSVLVAGFECLSPDPDDAMLNAGIVSDLATTLSYWRWFPVLQPAAVGWRTTRDTALTDLARETGARYVVHGSLRRSGDRLRISATLADGANGRALWSQNFDGQLADAFVFQDDVSRTIVSKLAPEISHAEAVRIARHPPSDLVAWQIIAQADEVERNGGPGYGSQQANDEQMALVQRAMELDPQYSRAWTRLAKIHWRRFLMGWEPDRAAAIAASLEASERAMTLDPDDWEAHAYRALALIFGHHDYVRGEHLAREANRLNPSTPLGRHAMGCALEWLGQPGEALEHLEVIFKLDPAPGNEAAVLGDITTCRMFLGDHTGAVEAAERLITIAPRYARGLQRCAASFGMAGKAEMAARSLKLLVEVQPDFSFDYVRGTYPFSQPADLETFLDGLRKAGWRE